MDQPTLDPIHDILYGASKALILKIAIEADVFTAIDRGYCSANAVAEFASSNVNGIRSLLDALVSLGFLEKLEGDYQLTTTSAAFLVKGKPSYYGGSFMDALLPWAWAESSQAMTALQSENGAGKEITDDAAVDLWQPWCEAHALAWENIIENAKHLWDDVAQHVALPKSSKVLDLACGHGLWTLALAQRDPQARITAMDHYDDVLNVARRLADDMGLVDRVETVRGDITEVIFTNSQFDIVHIGGILYLFTAREIEDILTRVAAGMRPGSLLVVNTMIADPDRCLAMGPLIQSFRRFLYNGGCVPTFDEYKTIFEAADFIDTTQVRDSVLIANLRGR